MSPRSSCPVGPAAVLVAASLAFVSCGNHRRTVGATLADLVVTPGVLAPAFDPLREAYVVELAHADHEVFVTATLADPGAALSVGEIAAPAGRPFGPLAIPPGETEIAVTVSGPEARAARTYRIAVRRPPGLHGLDLSAGTLEPEFRPDVHEYRLALRAPVLALTPRIDDPGVRVAVEGAAATPNQPVVLDLGLGARTLPIELTSADGRTTSTYVLHCERSTPTLAEAAYAKALNAGILDGYGTALACVGDRIAVGVPGEDSLLDPRFNHAHDSGAVYVLEHGAAGWEQTAMVKATNADPFDLFGSAVALSGDTLVVGAPQEASSARGVNGNKLDNSAPGSGAVYVFVRAATGWELQAYLKASNTGHNDRFGAAVAIDGDRIAVGAPGEASGARGVGGVQNDDSLREAGAVYVFGRVGDHWVQEAYIKATNSGAFDRFGSAVALHGDLLVVGAPYEDSAATGIDGDGSSDEAIDSGAVYLFRAVNGIWHAEAYVKASNTGADDAFGRTVAVMGDLVAVGAPGEASAGDDEGDDSAPGAGAVYVFARDASGWHQQARLKARSPRAGDAFGSALAFDGVVLAVGAPGDAGAAPGLDGDPQPWSAPESGAAWVFVRDRSTWFLRHYVKASHPDPGDRFGAALAGCGPWFVSGAPGEDGGSTGIGGDPTSNARRDSGAAFVFAVQ